MNYTGKILKTQIKGIVGGNTNLTFTILLLLPLLPYICVVFYFMVPLIPLFKSFNKIKIPLYLSPVRAGFPSPADDYIEKQLDLNEHLIKHPAATFILKAMGTSPMEACKISTFVNSPSNNDPAIIARIV